jgi:hypothetical protein
MPRSYTLIFSLASRVVEHDHAAAAAEQRPPHLHRREPVDVHVRDQPPSKNIVM